MSDPTILPSSFDASCNAEAYWQQRADQPLGEHHINLACLLLNHPSGMDRTAVASPDGFLTYADLMMETRRTASALACRHVAPGDRVIVALDDDHMQLCTILGCWAMGAIPVVLNPHQSAEGLAHVIDDTEAVLCLVYDDRQHVVDEAMTNTSANPCVLTMARNVFLQADDWRLAEGDTRWQQFYAAPANAPQYIQYSSGTTGKPKGILHSADDLMAAVFEMAAGFFSLTCNDVIYTISRTFFAYGMVYNLALPLGLNATTVRDARWPRPDHVCSNLLQYRPTVLFGVPLHFSNILSFANLLAGWAPRLALSAGAPLSDVLRQRWQTAFGQLLHDGLASSESMQMVITTYPNGAITAPTPHTRISVRDRHGEPVDTGEPGELWLATTSLTSGYWRRPDLDQQRFHVDEDGQRWFKTGDMFLWASDGGLRFEGRVDDCFKIKGRWVAPLEVEEAVLKHVPDVKGCLLVEGRAPSGSMQTVLFIEMMPNAVPDECRRTIEAALLPLESHKRPACYCLLSQLPITPNGKPDRNALRGQVASVLARKTGNPTLGSSFA